MPWLHGRTLSDKGKKHIPLLLCSLLWKLNVAIGNK